MPGPLMPKPRPSLGSAKAEPAGTVCDETVSKNSEAMTEIRDSIMSFSKAYPRAYKSIEFDKMINNILCMVEKLTKQSNELAANARELIKEHNGTTKSLIRGSENLAAAKFSREPHSREYAEKARSKRSIH